MTPPAFCKVSRGEACRYYRLRLDKSGEIFSEFCGITINGGQYAFRVMNHCPEREHRGGMEDLYLYSYVHIRIYAPTPEEKYPLEFLKEGRYIFSMITNRPFWEDPKVEEQVISKFKERFEWFKEEKGMFSQDLILERSIQAIHNIAKVRWEKHQDDLQWEEGA